MEAYSTRDWVSIFRFAEIENARLEHSGELWWIKRDYGNRRVGADDPFFSPSAPYRRVIFWVAGLKAARY
jgi:hypothetical protein